MTNEELHENLILLEYEKYSEKEYEPVSYAKFVTQKLIEARNELSKLHQPTVSWRSELCNHVFKRVERGGEFQGNQCECGEWEDLT